MTKLASVLLLLFSLVPAYAASPPKSCPIFIPSKDKAKWKWMDRDCHLRTRAYLDQILANHKLWLQKYRVYFDEAVFEGKRDSPRAHGAFDDPLRANFSGADLSLADLTGADFQNADLTGANLYQADLTGAHLDDADLTDANLLLADLSSSELIRTDLSDVDLTGAKLWYADFEPKALPPVNSIARAGACRRFAGANPSDPSMN